MNNKVTENVVVENDVVVGSSCRVCGVVVDGSKVGGVVEMVSIYDTNDVLKCSVSAFEKTLKDVYCNMAITKECMKTKVEVLTAYAKGYSPKEVNAYVFNRGIRQTAGGGIGKALTLAMTEDIINDFILDSGLEVKVRHIDAPITREIYDSFLLEDCTEWIKANPRKQADFSIRKALLIKYHNSGITKEDIDKHFTKARRMLSVASAKDR